MVKLTNEEFEDGRVLDLTSPVGALKAFLSEEGVDGGFPDGTGGGGGVFDLGAGDKRKDCYFRCWGHSGQCLYESLLSINKVPGKKLLLRSEIYTAINKILRYYLSGIMRNGSTVAAP
jgi:hypothetical protein